MHGCSEFYKKKPIIMHKIFKLLVFFYYKPVPRPGTSPKWMAELENEDIGLLQGDFNQIHNLWIRDQNSVHKWKTQTKV